MITQDVSLARHVHEHTHTHAPAYMQGAIPLRSYSEIKVIPHVHVLMYTHAHTTVIYRHTHSSRAPHAAALKGEVRDEHEIIIIIYVFVRVRVCDGTFSDPKLHMDVHTSCTCVSLRRILELR